MSCGNRFLSSSGVAEIESLELTLPSPLTSQHSSLSSGYEYHNDELEAGHSNMSIASHTTGGTDARGCGRAIAILTLLIEFGT